MFYYQKKGIPSENPFLFRKELYMYFVNTKPYFTRKKKRRTEAINPFYFWYSDSLSLTYTSYRIVHFVFSGFRPKFQWKWCFSVPEDLILFEQTERTLMTCRLSRVSPWSSQLAKLPCPEVIQLFSYSTPLSTNFSLLIHVTVKMSTIVGILAITSMINTTSESLKVRKFLFCCN